MALWFLKNMLLSFGITVIIELITAWIWELRSSFAYKTVCLVNMLTNPALVFIVLSFRYWTGTVLSLWAVLIMEVVIWLLEGWIYEKKQIGVLKPYLFAVTANVASYSLGCLINLLI